MRFTRQFLLLFLPGISTPATTRNSRIFPGILAGLILGLPPLFAKEAGKPAGPLRAVLENPRLYQVRLVLEYHRPGSGKTDYVTSHLVSPGRLFFIHRVYRPGRPRPRVVLFEMTPANYHRFLLRLNEVVFENDLTESPLAALDNYQSASEDRRATELETRPPPLPPAAPDGSPDFFKPHLTVWIEYQGAWSGKLKRAEVRWSGKRLKKLPHRKSRQLETLFEFYRQRTVPRKKQAYRTLLRQNNTGAFPDP